VLEGSVRRSGTQIRINAQLIDGSTGGHLWAERFDGSMSDVFSLQDSVNERIVEALQVSLTLDERRQISEVETTNPEAYDALLKGLEQYQLFSPDTNRLAIRFFKRAIELDPDYARAYANVGLAYAQQVNFSWPGDREESIRQGLVYAAEAIDLDNSIPQAYLTRSALYLAQRKHDDAVAAARKLIQLHPSYADGYIQLAFVLSYAGDLNEALDAMAKGKELNPQSSYVYMALEGRVLFLLGRYEQAREILEKSISRNPAFDRTQLMLAAVLAELGNLDDASWALDEALLLNPDISIALERRESNYRRSEDLERYLAALRKAGVPEI
jgi:adenylate cyclase